jgi:hypothetical protein
MGVSGQRQAPAALSPSKSPCTHYAGSWVGPSAGLKGNWEEKITGFEPRIVQLYRLRSPGHRTHFVAYATHRHVRKADRFTARLVSPKCVLAHASRFQRTSDSSRTDSRALAFPHDSYSRREIRHWNICAFLLSAMIRAGFSDFETPIRTRIRHYSKPLDRKRWFFQSCSCSLFTTENSIRFSTSSCRYEQHDRYLFILSQYRSHYIPPATLTKLSSLSGRYWEIQITVH